MLTRNDLLQIQAVVRSELQKELVPIKIDVRQLREALVLVKKDLGEVKKSLSNLAVDVSILANRVKLIEKDVRKIKADVRFLKTGSNRTSRSLKVTISGLDSEILEVKQRIAKIEDHLSLN